jgi:hypothetical protein
MAARDARRLRVAVAIGVAFFLLYLACGATFYMRAPRVFRHLDQIFDADIPSRVIDLTHAQGGHERTELHPLFVLLLNPIGHSLRGVLRAVEAPGVAGVGSLAAVILCAAAGGATVGVFFLLLRGLALPPIFAVGWSLVLGLSASHLVFSSLPESYAFSALSLVTLFALGTRPTLPRAGLVAASVVSFGMLVTNLGAAVLVRARWLDVRRPWAALRSTAIHVAVVIAIAGGLSLVQLFFYPGTRSFLHVREVGGTDHASFVWPRDYEDALFRAREVAAHLGLFNVATPKLVVRPTGGPRTGVTLHDPRPGALRAIGVVHALLWLALGAAALVSGIRRRLYLEPLAAALAGWIAFHAALHSVFGVALFLYSCQWTFAVVALVAVALDRLARDSAWLRAALGLLLAAQAVNNALFLWELFLVFARSF